MPGRIVVEVQPGRRLVREYDEQGTLLRIRIEPATVGPAEPLPIPQPQPKPQPQPQPQPKPQPESQPQPTPAPLPQYDITTEPLDRPLVVSRPRTRPVTLPAPSVVERALEAAAWEQPAAPPLAFEIVAVERVVPQPQPEPEPQPQPEPVAAPEPPPTEVEVRIEGPAPEPAADVPVAFDAPPVPLRERVPDLEARVEAALRAGAGKPRPRRRAPLAVPRFAPLTREPWEDRLDKVLSAA